MSLPGGCRRLLHACYCCDDVGSAEAFLVGGLGLAIGMRTSGGPFDGMVLGLDGSVEADVSFAFDHRGPRTSPAIEVQAWLDPKPVGSPHVEPWQRGIQALGVAVADLPAAVSRATAAGATVVGEATAGGSVLGGPAVVVRDPNGIGFDLVGSADDEHPRMAHLRLSVGDVDASIAWYRRLGFEVVVDDRSVTASGALFGRHGEVVLHVAQLRLPDEPLRLLVHQWVDPASSGAPYPVANHRGLFRAALGVDDTREAVRALEADGVVIDRPPSLVELSGTKVPDMWIAFLRDPDGIPMELVERPRSAFAAAP